MHSFNIKYLYDRALLGIFLVNFLKINLARSIYHRPHAKFRCAVKVREKHFYFFKMYLNLANKFVHAV